MNTGAMLEVELAGVRSSVRFNLLGCDGTLLEKLSLHAVGTTFRGAFRIRHQAFRLAVTGRDEAAQPFQRLYPFMFQAGE